MSNQRSTQVVSVIALGLAVLLVMAAPAFAMRIESGDLPARAAVVRDVKTVPQPVAPQAAAPQVSVPVAVAPGAVAPIAAGASVSVYAGPVAPSAPVSAPTAPSDSVALAAPIEQAKVIDAPSKGGEIEFVGKIDTLIGSQPNYTLTIGTNIVKTNSQTQIIGTLAVGKLVQVKGTAQTDGSILASRVRVEDAPGAEGEVEFRGPIASLPGTLDFVGNWVVGDFTVTVNLSTTIDTTRGAVVMGAIAEVKSTRQPDGSLLATRIKIEDAAEFENEIEFKGTISNLTGSGPYTLTVAGHTVTTNAQTQISGTLANGALVEVRGLLQAGGSVLASWIKVEDPAGVEVEFTAHVLTLPANFIGQWTFDGGQPAINVNAGTLIDQSRGPAVAGALVQVTALKQPDNSLLAIRIKVEND